MTPKKKLSPEVALKRMIAAEEKWVAATEQVTECKEILLKLRGIESDAHCDYLSARQIFFESTED
jgi:hypothetical protein